jgi:hypothetical protein
MREVDPNLVAFQLMERRIDSDADGFLRESTKKDMDDRPEEVNPASPEPLGWNHESELPRLEDDAQRPMPPVTGIKVTDPDGSDLVKVVLGPFARDSIEDRFGPHLNRGVQSALRHYARRVRSARRPPEVPAFMREVEIDPATAIELDVAVPYEVQSALEREARLQLLALDRVVAHAIFVYLSDVDAGIRSAAPAAEEVEPAPRYDGHAERQLPPARRSRGTARPHGPLRRRGRAGGRSRFGRR